jgi:nitrite reductase/ring-hydroxylating ferredoxin subunit/uncharacterized membrane protein
VSVSDIPTRQLGPLERLGAAIESAGIFDAPGKAIGRAARGVLDGEPVSDVLSGTWLGHPVHPMLTDVVIGSFTSASLLDLIGGKGSETASRRLIMLGIAAYAPTALTGVKDWADTEISDTAVRRAGLVHAGTNAVALGLYSASLAFRRRGSHAGGVLLGAAGVLTLMAGGYIGGHLSMRRGVGPNQTAFDPGPEDWNRAADAAQLPERRPTRVFAGDTPILLLRNGDQVFAIHDRCSHRGCSLSEGEIDGSTVECACHGSRFDLRDGSLRRGPATAPQPSFQVRERDGVIEIRRLSPTTP